MMIFIYNRLLHDYTISVPALNSKLGLIRSKWNLGTFFFQFLDNSNLYSYLLSYLLRRANEGWRDSNEYSELSLIGWQRLIVISYFRMCVTDLGISILHGGYYCHFFKSLLMRINFPLHPNDPHPTAMFYHYSKCSQTPLSNQMGFLLFYWCDEWQINVVCIWLLLNHL